MASARAVSGRVGAALTAAAALGPVLRRLPTASPPVANGAAFAPHLSALALPAAVLAGVGRRPRAVLAATAVAAVGAATYAPLFRPDGTRRGTGLTVLAANCLLGRADPRDIVRATHEFDVDVLMLEELTDQLRAGVAAAGLDALYPHHVTRPAERAAGVGLWSLREITDAQRPDGLDCVAGRIEVGGRPVTVAAIHVPAPAPWDRGWAAHLARLGGWLAGTDRVLVGGDFNATIDHQPFRALLRDGVADAAVQAGAGYPVSFPAGGRLPPVVAIDHVLTRGVRATSVRTVPIRGTDHRALLVRIAV